MLLSHKPMINLCGENEERGDNDNEGRVFNDN